MIRIQKLNWLKAERIVNSVFQKRNQMRETLLKFQQPLTILTDRVRINKGAQFGTDKPQKLAIQVQKWISYRDCFNQFKNARKSRMILIWEMIRTIFKMTK